MIPLSLQRMIKLPNVFAILNGHRGIDIGQLDSQSPEALATSEIDYDLVQITNPNRMNLQIVFRPKIASRTSGSSH